jgi:hypothetical protein
VARIAKRISPERGGQLPRTLEVVVRRDGQLELVAVVDPGERRAPAQVSRAAAISVDLDAATDEALVTANRAKLAELRSLPSSGIPDFPDALVASVTRLVPGLSQAMTTLALNDAGRLAEDAVIAGASALAYIANWLADRGFGPDSSEPLSPAPPLLYGDAVGLVAWLLLDWIHRSIEAAAVDDSQLEDDLDAYYPRWSRSDFEWDITLTRVVQGPLLNPYPLLSGSARDAVDETVSRPPPAIARRRMHTFIAPAPGVARTAVHSVDPSILIDQRARGNRARERRQ